MALGDAQKFADDWLDSWNSHDLERIVSHYADNLEFKSPLILERYAGSNGIIYTKLKLKEYFAIGLGLNPKLKFQLKDILIGVDCLTIYYENARGGTTAELFEFNKNSKIVRSISCYSN